MKHIPARPASCPVAPRGSIGTGQEMVPGRVIFSQALILNKNPQLWMDTN